MLAAQSLREHIQQFLGDVLPLDDFEDWLVGASWNMHRNADREVQQLVGAVELRLAEYSQGHLDPLDLKHELHMLLLHGCQPKAMLMPVFSLTFDPELALTVSGTTQEPSTIQRIVVAVDRMTTSGTRSASTRTVTAREALRAAS